MVWFHSLGQAVRRGICALRGHDTLLQFGDRRLFLKCVMCGYETTGWFLVDEPSSTVTETMTRGEEERRHVA